MRNNLRVAFIGLLTLVIMGAIWSAFSTPRTGNGGTTAAKSVTLVVDFGKHSNRPVKSFALDDLPATVKGWDLFAAANLQVEGTSQYPTGFVCRISGWPAKANQDCEDTPTYNEGHWAYYVTGEELGSGWMLSGLGAAMHSPNCAGYEGWSWVDPGAESSPPRFKPAIRACK